MLNVRLYRLRYLFALGAFVCFFSMLFSGCSDNSDEYVAKLPVFSDVKFSPEVITSGSQITATAVRNYKGKYLYDATYSWELSTSDTIGQTQNYTKVVDPVKEKEDPTFTFIAPSTSGQYTLTLKINYKVSGSGRVQSSSSYDIKHGTVSGFLSALYGSQTITKTFSVSK